MLLISDFKTHIPFKVPCHAKITSSFCFLFSCFFCQKVCLQTLLYVDQRVHLTHEKLHPRVRSLQLWCHLKIQSWALWGFACPSHANVVSCEVAGVVTAVSLYAVTLDVISHKSIMSLIFIFRQKICCMRVSFMQSSVMSCFLRRHRCFLVSSEDGGWQRWIDGRVFAFDPSNCP